MFGLVSLGDPDEIRTRVTAVKGRCLRPLDHRANVLVVQKRTEEKQSFLLKNS